MYYSAPLSPVQVQQALKFAEETLGKEDPYNLMLPKSRVILTVGTAFGRIAAYARLQYEQNLIPDAAFVQELNGVQDLRTHYSVQAISTHRRISIRRCMQKLDKRRNGQMKESFLLYQDMEHGSVSSLQNKYLQTVWFPYPHNTSPYDYFEIGVPKFLGMDIERIRIPDSLR